MSIIIPNPHDSYIRCLFSLDRGAASARHSRGLRATTSLIRDPVWAASFSTSLLSISASAPLRAWEKRLRGGVNLFTAPDYSQPFPLAYPSASQIPKLGGATWGGSATISGFSNNGNSINVSNLPPNYQFTVGDRLSIIEGGRHGYHEIIADITASSSGSAAIQVEPPVFTNIFSQNAECNFIRPLCKFRMEHNTFTAEGTVNPTSITFDAVQVI